MFVAQQEKKLSEITRHVLIGEEFAAHILTPYCKCKPDSILGNHIYSSYHESEVVEHVFLHSQIEKHEMPTYMTLTFMEGKQVDNKTLKEI